MDKPVYLVLSILEISKVAIHEFWCDFVKPKQEEKAKLCYIDTDSFVVYIKTGDIYADITKDVTARFDTSNYELYTQLPNGKNKKVIGFMKDELSEKNNGGACCIVTENI